LFTIGSHQHRINYGQIVKKCKDFLCDTMGWGEPLGEPQHIIVLGHVGVRRLTPTYNIPDYCVNSL
jgi:hypothetical protein